MTVFKHKQALVESDDIGEGTRIWAFAHILPGARIGSGCNICDNVFIENDVCVGNNVTIKSGVQLWDGVTIEDDVFIGPNATFTNDLFPRSQQYPEHFARTLIKRGASIGANATLLAGITVGMNAMVGAGSVVTKSVPPNAVVSGNPARIAGYVSPGESQVKIEKSESEDRKAGKQPLGVEGVGFYQLPFISDLRGSLSFAELDQYLPFKVQRYFLVFDVPSQEIRGEHAHRALHQFLICVKGSCSVVVDDGKNAQEVELSSPDKGLHIPPMVWGVQYKYTRDAVLLVLASDKYDENDYIREYGQFIAELNKQHT
ncbi:MAG: WxcM-like domain-containing protein [Gammaproteobacteria bacterium]|nr:WxcM-like domain-containing protein [Gammaproteobacteria bacterium]